VSGQSLKLLTSIIMNGLYKLMSDINRQVRNYSTCVCFIFLDFLSKLYKLRFISSELVKLFPTLSKEVNCDMENSD
jgi:hypothetical protein